MTSDEGGARDGDRRRRGKPSPAPRAARQLPELGEWDGPIYGELGVLAAEPDGDRVQCHACGAWFRFLANHVWRTHQLTADEYRAVFGLAAEHGLVSPTLAERLRRQALRTLRPYYERAADLAHSLSFEQRSAFLRGRKLRLETRLDPRWQATRRAVAQRQAERLREWYRSLDPTARAAYLARLGVPRPRTPATCVVCGARFFSTSHGPKAKTCGPVCARTHRTRLGRALRTAARPAVRAKIAAAARRRRAEYDRLVAALRTLGAAALAALPAAERDLLRLYYGLDGADARPHSVRELTELTGLARREVEQLLRSALLRLLDPGAAGLAATCVVCGRPFAQDVVNSRRVTCGRPICAREQGLATLRASGGREKLSAAARERGRAAAEQLRTLDEHDRAAWETLPTRDRLIVRLYHGLPVEGLRVDRPWTKREIAAHLGAGVTVWQVTQTLTRGVERLLRPGEGLSDEERQATRRARISAAARTRGRPVAEALRGLPSEAFDRLPEPERTLVRRYYGLEDGRPWTKRELAGAHARSHEWVGRALARATVLLLGERAPRSDERPCLICGGAFAPEPGAYRSTRQTCGDACNRELRRRNAVASRAARRSAA